MTETESAKKKKKKQKQKGKAEGRRRRPAEQEPKKTVQRPKGPRKTSLGGGDGYASIRNPEAI